MVAPPPAPAPAPDPSLGTTHGTTHPAAGGTAPGIGEPCGPDDRCAAGLTCVSYYGIAGTRGPQFKSCEIRCKDNTSCPKGKDCVIVSDGPGQVCR
jgi:hypothetical protein